jgi:hypothetical protein
VDGHDLNTGRIVHTAENLVLRQCDVERLARARVSAIACQIAPSPALIRRPRLKATR